MTTTSSTVWATSERTWLESSTVRPSLARPRRKSRSQRMPSGSSPLAGSSRARVWGAVGGRGEGGVGGVAERGAGGAEPLRHAEREAAGAAAAGVREVDELEHL